MYYLYRHGDKPPSRPKKLREFMDEWRMAYSEHLKFALEPEVLPLSRVWDCIYRLKKSGYILSSKIGDRVVYFDSSYKKRWNHFESLSPGERVISFQKFGVQHHLELVNISCNLMKLFPGIEVNGNVFSDHVYRTFNSASGKEEQSFVPDLIYTRPIGDRPFVFIEVERTMKSKERYSKRWLGFEGDRLVGLCVYWVFDDEMHRRLTAQIEDYFDRDIGNRVFRIGIIKNDDFKESANNAEIKLYGVGNHQSTTTVQEVFKYEPKA